MLVALQMNLAEAVVRKTAQSCTFLMEVTSVMSSHLDVAYSPAVILNYNLRWKRMLPLNLKC